MNYSPVVEVLKTSAGEIGIIHTFTLGEIVIAIILSAMLIFMVFDRFIGR